MKWLTLRRFNNGLSIVVIGLCLYLILAPLWPQAALRLQDAPPLVKAEEAGQPEPIPDKNTLVIPRIKMQQLVHESQTGYPALNLGVWRRPQAGAPGTGKNTVLVGHRFTYGGRAVFYHLDKIKKDDKLILYWNKHKYVYQVDNILVVPPTAGEIEDADVGEERLTIYTCTPLWSAKDRLVIQAGLAEEDGR